MCKTCIYRPDSVVDKTRVVRAAIKEDSAVICHATLDKPGQAVCAGFFANESTKPLQMAKTFPEFLKRV